MTSPMPPTPSARSFSAQSIPPAPSPLGPPEPRRHHQGARRLDQALATGAERRRVALGADVALAPRSRREGLDDRHAGEVARIPACHPVDVRRRPLALARPPPARRWTVGPTPRRRSGPSRRPRRSPQSTAHRLRPRSWPRRPVLSRRAGVGRPERGPRRHPRPRAGHRRARLRVAARGRGPHAHPPHPRHDAARPPGPLAPELRARRRGNEARRLVEHGRTPQRIVP